MRPGTNLYHAANLRSPRVESASRATRQLALASAINCTCALELHAVIPEPTRFYNHMLCVQVPRWYLDRR